MNMLHFKYVVEVEKAKSITKAAQSLFMGQPNLSKAIKELENEIGIKIFMRTTKGVVPTAKGSEFLSYAKIILSQLDELQSLYKHTDAQSDSVSFNIAVPRATYTSVTFAEYANQINSNKQVDIHFKETDAMNAINTVARGEMDLAILRYQFTYEDYILKLIAENNLSYESIWSFELRLMMSQSHPLASYDEVPYHKLSGFTEIVHGDYQVPSLSFSQINKEAGLDAPLKRIYVYDRGSQYDILQRVSGTYMWVSPVPDDVLAQHHLTIRKCPLSGIVNKDIAIYPKSTPLNKYGQQFLNLLKNNISTQYDATTIGVH